MTRQVLCHILNEDCNFKREGGITMDLKTMLSAIEPADQKLYDSCIARWDNIAKPVGSLGKMETLLAKVAAASGNVNIDIEKKCVLVFCADNGVLAQGVAQSTSDVTTAIARSLMAGTTSVSTMSKAAGADVFPVDMGMVETVPGILDCRLAAGTADMSQGPAMTRAQAERAIATGIKLVQEKQAAGYRLIATGEAGIGNTTTSSAIASVLLNLPVEQATGRGSGLTDAGLERKCCAIASAIAVNKPDPKDPVDVLQKVGGFDIAAMTGAFLGGAIYHVPIIMDGFISAVAALCAVTLCPAVKDYILPSHISAEPAGILLMERMGFDPMIHGNLRLGEGTGAVALMPLLDLAAAVYHNAATFEKIEVEAYERWSC